MPQCFAQTYSLEEQQYIDSLNSVISNPHSHDTSKIVARYKFGETTMQFRTGYWDSIAQDCQSLYKSSPSTKVKQTLLVYLAEALNNVGYVYMNQGNNKKALEYYHKSLEAREEIEGENDIATTLNNIGMIYFNQGDIPKSLEYIHKGLRLREDKKDSKGMANSSNNIGYIYDNQGEPKKALEYYRKSLAIQEGIDDKNGIALSWVNIGTIYHYQNNFNEALECYYKSLKIYKELGVRKGEALSLNNIASAYKQQKKADEALEYYQKSLKIREEIADKEGMAFSLNNIGRVYYNEKSFLEAKKYASQSLALARAIGYPENIKNAAKLLSEINEEQGNGMEALKMHKLYISMRDSIKNEATLKATAQQQAKYEYEKQKVIDDKENEKQIAISFEQEQKQKIISYSVAGGLGLVILFSIFIFNRLQITRKQKITIEEQKIEVEKTNKELEIEKQNIELKALKAQINPHFIFNSLNSIQKHIIENNKEEAHDYLTKFGKIMRSTLENSEEKSIPIKEEKELLQMYVELEAKRLKNGIDFKVKIDESIDIYNLKIPPMLLQPFIENAIKHGITDIEGKGEIVLKIEQNGENLICSVVDNGIGRKASEAKKKKSVQAEHRSMGMEITQNRLRNIWKKYGEKHEILITDLIDNSGKALGTSVQLIIPLDF